jgi:ABC-type enterochelin transport system permease subunit
MIEKKPLLGAAFFLVLTEIMSRIIKVKYTCSVSSFVCIFAEYRGIEQ